MEAMEKDDYDLLFLQIQARMKKSRRIKDRKKDMDFGMGFLIQIPDTFYPADRNEAERLFWTKDRPPVILLSGNKSAGITFQTIPDWEGKTAKECGGKLHQLLERMDSRTVFYESGIMGRQVQAFWMEYKSFAKRERVYNLAFLFGIKERIILGTFFSPFEEYGLWKEEILKLLDTIREG